MHMTNAIGALSNTVSSDALWGTFGECVPYIGIVVLVALGFYFIRRMIKGVSKGKAKV